MQAAAVHGQRHCCVHEPTARYEHRVARHGTRAATGAGSNGTAADCASVSPTDTDSGSCDDDGFAAVTAVTRSTADTTARSSAAASARPAPISRSSAAATSARPARDQRRLRHRRPLRTRDQRRL